MTYEDIGAQIGKLVQEKQNCYGDSFSKAGGIMRILYPDGVSTEQMDDALTVVRVLDKLFRIATDRDALGESPWRDIAGYALLSVKRVEDARPTAKDRLEKLATVAARPLHAWEDIKARRVATDPGHIKTLEDLEAFVATERSPGNVPIDCGVVSNPHMVGWDFPCVLDTGHQGLHQDRYGSRWEQVATPPYASQTSDCWAEYDAYCKLDCDPFEDKE